MLDFTKTRLNASRPLTDYSKVQILISSFIRNRRAFVREPPDGTYLNVGCGPHVAAGFCNLDYAWRPGVDICWDITKGLPVKSGTASGIFTEHCLEHITFEECAAVLREFRRVAKRNSAVRIVVPDGALYIDRYVNKADMPYGSDDLAEGVYTPMMSVNRIMRKHGHQFIYDFDTMAALLARTGFRDIRRQVFRQGSDPKLLIDTPWRQIESLYVEAIA